MKKLSIISLVLIVGLMGITAPAAGITVIWTSSNTTVEINPGYTIEFENPLTGVTQVNGYTILEWRDADYTPPTYDDWTVSHPAEIDGDANQIWLRIGNRHWAQTVTTVPSTIVSIHLTADDNDGDAEILVDGGVVAQLDMTTPPGEAPAIVYVTGLALTTHTIRVAATSASSPDDVAIYGAAALRRSIPTLNQWGMVILFLLLMAAATVVIRLRRKATV